jgi:hypothetical protein
MITSLKRPPLAPVPGTDRPEIEISTDEFKVIDEAIAALAVRKDVFQCNGELVHIVIDDRPLARKTSSGGPAPRKRVIPLPLLRDMLSECAQFLSFKKGKDSAPGEWVKTHPPDFAVKGVAARGQYALVRHLESIVESPMLRPDGTILDEPGYDERTGILYSPTIDFDRVLSHPTLADAQRALAELREVFADFPFLKAMHEAAALASLLTMFARHAFEGPAPLTLIDGNTRGCGKGLLADAMGHIATGRPIPVMANPKDDAEMAKTITSLADVGASIILIDNIEGDLGSPSLDMALTGRVWTGRRLGVNQMVQAPIKFTWLATGNNVRLVGDLVRRVEHVRLESPEEKPEERTGFRHENLRVWVVEHRAHLVIACLTVLRGYIVAGRPNMRLKPWGSFEAWTDLVRASIVWVGLPDPGATRDDLAEACDTEGNCLAALIDALEISDPERSGLTTSQILQLVGRSGNDHAALRDAINELCPTRDGKPPSTRILGKKLQHVRRRIVNGRCVEQRGKYQGAVLWSVAGAVST